MLKRNSINLKYEKEMTLNVFVFLKFFDSHFGSSEGIKKHQLRNFFRHLKKLFHFSFSTFGSLAIATSVTKLGNFLKYFVTNVIKKVARMYCDFLGYFKNINYQVKVTVANFGVTFGKFGQLFISTYDHTGRHHLFSTL